MCPEERPRQDQEGPYALPPLRAMAEQERCPTCGGTRESPMMMESRPPHPWMSNWYGPPGPPCTDDFHAPPSTPQSERWRVGRKVGRTIYRQLGPKPSDDDPLIGVMDSPELAQRAVANALVEKQEEAMTPQSEGEEREWPGSKGWPALICNECGGISDGPIEHPRVCSCDDTRYTVIEVVSKVEASEVEADRVAGVEALHELQATARSRLQSLEAASQEAFEAMQAWEFSSVEGRHALAERMFTAKDRLMRALAQSPRPTERPE